MVELVQISFSLILAFFGVQILRTIEWRAMWRRGRIHLVTRPTDTIFLLPVALLVAGFFAMNMLGVIILQFELMPDEILDQMQMDQMSDAQMAQSILFTMFMQILFVFACFFPVLSARAGWPNRAYGFREIRLQHAVVLALALILVSLPLVALAALANMGLVWILNQTIGYEPGTQEAVRMLADSASSPMLAFLMVFTAVIGAPVSEEFTFRGVFLPFFCRTIGFWPGLVVVSLAFGIMHVHFPSILPLSMLGAMFAVGYILSRSIVVPILMHFFFNGFNVLMIFLFPEQATAGMIGF